MALIGYYLESIIKRLDLENALNKYYKYNKMLATIFMLDTIFGNAFHENKSENNQVNYQHAIRCRDEVINYAKMHKALNALI